MSGAADEAMDYWERGLSSVPDKYVCSRHIDEAVIARYIKRNAQPGKCDYCGKQTGVVQLEDLMLFIMDAVGALYAKAENFMGYNSREGGYQGTTYDAWEIITDNFELEIDHNQLYDDMQGSIDYDSIWGDEDEYYDSQADILIYQWDYFKKVVKHRSRYLFGNTNSLFSDEYRIRPFDILKDIGNKINKFSLVKKMNAGSRLYRVRQHERAFIITEAAQLCSPDIQYAVTPNRMSPAGVSMFYGAFDMETCMKETIAYEDKKRRFFTCGRFETRTNLNMIDLSWLPPLPSPFDVRKRKDFYPLVFLREFVNDLSRPIEKDGRLHIDYVPTQIVTEYFRYTFSDRRRAGNKIDGIIYPSARNSGKQACVLFMDHEESLKSLQFHPGSIQRRSVGKPIPSATF